MHACNNIPIPYQYKQYSFIFYLFQYYSALIMDAIKNHSFILFVTFELFLIIIMRLIMI